MGTGLKSYRQIKAEAAAKKGTSIASGANKKLGSYNISGRVSRYFGETDDITTALNKIDAAINSGDEAEADALISAEKTKIENLKTKGAAYYDPAVLSERADGYLNLLNSRFVDYEYETPETVTYTDSRSRTSHTEHVKKKTRKSAVQIERDYKQYVSDLKALDEDKTEYVTSGELYVTQKERLDDLISRGDELRAAFSAQGLTEAQGNVEGVVSSLKEGKTKLDDWRKTAGYSKTYFNMSDALSGEDGEDGKIDYNGGRYTRDEVSSAQETLADINKTYAGLSDRAAAFSARYVKGEKPDAEELEEFYNDVKALRGELSGLKEYTDVSDTRGYGRGLTGNAPEPTLKGSLLNRLISDYEKELDTLQNAAKEGKKLGYFSANLWGGLKSAASGTGELLSEVTSQWSTGRSGRDIEASYRYINNPEYAEAPKPEDYKISDEEYQKILSDKLGDLPEGYVPVGIDSTPTKEEYERHQYETALKKYNDTKNFAGENGDYINQIEVRDALILKSNAGEDNSVNVGQDKNFTEAMKALGTSDPEEMLSLLAEHYGNFSDEEKKAWRLLYSPSKAALALAAENDTESLAGLYGDGKSAKDILSDRYYIEDEYKRTYKTDTDALTDILNDGSVRNAFTLGNLTSADYEYLYDAYGISKEDVSSVSERFKTTIDTLKNDISYGNGLSDEFKELWGGAAQSIGMMLPATVGSLAGSLIPGVAGTIASSVLSGALFTAPVITTSYEQSISEGHLPNEAKKYAIVQGISEGATELLFSGFGNAANSVLGKLMAKTPVVKGILKTASRSTVGRIMANAMNIIGSSASEFGEEYLQQFLEPLYRNYAYGEDNTPEVFNRDNFKAGVAGAMVGALMSGFGVAVSNGSNAVSKARMTAAFNEKSFSQADIYESLFGKEIVDSVNLPDEMKKKTISPSEVLIDQAQGYGKKYGESSFSAQALAKAGITGDTKTLSYRQIAALETAVGRDAAYEALSGILEGEQAEQFIKEINSAPLSKELKNNIINYNSIDEVARTELKNNKRATDEIVDAIFYAGYDVRSPIVQERQKHILTRADQTTRIDVSPARTVQNMISRYRAVLSPVGIEVSEATVKPVNDNSKVRADSYFDSTENKIYYYQGITDAEAFNFKMAHELVEAINAKGDGSFVADVLEVMKGNGAYSEETIEKLRRRYMDFYYELYNKKDNDAGLFGQQYRDEARKRAEATVTVALAEKEAVCDYIGELARGGELLRSLESTAKQNTESGAKARNLLTRIYEAVKNFIKKFRRAGQHTSNIEYDDLVKLEKRLRSFVEAKTGSEVKRTGKTYEGKETRGYAVSDNVPQYPESVNSDISDRMSDDDRDVYEALLEMYGAIKAGMEPRAEGERPVPKKNAEGKKISETARTVAEAEITTDEAYDTIRKLITEGKLTVETVDKKSVMEAADAALEATGINGAVADIKARFAAGDNISAVDIAKLQLAYNSLVNAGGEYDIEAIEEVIALMALAGTKTGQALNAFKYVKSLSPSGKLYMFNSVLDNINKILEKKWKKKFKKITIPAEMSENLLNSKTKDEQFEAEEAIKDYIAKETPVSVWDKLNAWRYLSMLGNPKTHLRNISGNVAMFGTRVAKDQVQAILEVVFEKMGVLDESERRKSFGYIPFAYIKAGASEFDALAGELIGGGKYNDKSGLEGDILDRRKIYRGDNWLSKALEWARTTNGWLLDKEDLIFMKSNFALSFGQIMRARKISLADYYNGKVSAEVISDIARLASKEALRMTFRDSSALANAFRKLSNSSNFLKGVTDAALPFKKTPANILTRALEYSPLGLMKSIFSDLHKVKQGELSVSDCIEHFAEGLTGTGIMLLGCMLAKWGILRSGEDDDDEEDFERLLGRQKFSIEIGGKSFTIDWITPISMPIIMGGTFYERFLSESKEYQNPTEFFSDMLLSISSLADPFVELSMLSGVSEALDAFSGKSDSGPGESALAVAVSLVESYASQYIPTLLGQITRSVFPARRSTKVDPTDAIPDSIEYNIRKLANKIPFALNMNQKYVDEWGKEQTSEGTLENIGNTLENFFSPAYINNVDEDEVEAALRELYTSTGEKSILPKWIKNKFTVSGKEYRLSDKQYSQGQKTFGQTAQSLIYEIVTSKAYKDMNDTEKVSAINKAYSYAQEAFRYEYAGEHLTDSKKMNGIYDECGTNKLDTAAKIFMCDAVITEKDMKGSAEKRAYINNANYNDEDKAVLFKHLAATKTDTEAISAAEKAGAGKKEIQSMILKFAALESEKDENETADDDERADSIASKQKISVIAGLDMDDKKKLKILKVFVSDKKDKDDPDKETAFEKLVTASEAGISVEDYITCRYAINDIESDKYKSGKKKGETVPGSKKKKVVKYINGLKITSEQKLLLFKQSGYQVKKGVRWRDVLNSIK